MDNTAPNQQQILDNQQLRLLSIFQYVVSGLAALFACIPIIHLVLGLILIFAPQKFGPGNGPPPAILGWFFVGFATVFILVGWTFAILILLAGWKMYCPSKALHVLFSGGLCGMPLCALWNRAWGVHASGP